ncbi:MAG: sugar transferase [Bacteroidales bacterium]|nr:sugar transferase [Bacteroidales bacterium]
MKVLRFRVISLAADIIILTLSFLVVVSTKPTSFRGYLPSHSLFFIALAILWIIISLANGKMHRGKIVSFGSVLYRVVSSNVIALSFTALLMYIFREYFYSRTIVLGTALIATALELLIGWGYIAYKKATVHNFEELDKVRLYKKKSEYDLVAKANGVNKPPSVPDTEINPQIVSQIEKECGADMAKAVIKMTGNKINDRTAVLSTTTVFNILSLPRNKYDYIINLHKINDIQRLDDFLEAVNSKLDHDGFLFCCVETKDQRKERLLKKFPPVINYIYYFFDFIIKRVLPKLKSTKKLYFILTRGSNAVISRAEALGRLSRAGFKIRQESFIGKVLCIEARKFTDPLPKNGETYGAMIALPRIGKNGEIIKVYKLRTMHPYSEYIQDYLYELHALQEGGKFRDDFRITTWGAIYRKIWFDELPMLINLFRGDMKLVGVRPLSKHYYDLYDKEVQERRIKYKPGIIPPFYADMPADLDGIQASEMKYLDAYDKHPVRTDFRYFWLSMYNIIFKNARSR